MRVILLSILVIGAVAKDTKDKNTVHDLIYKDTNNLYKDTNVLNFGDVAKIRIHQRLNTLNLDTTQRHIIDDIRVNADRCLNYYKDDYKVHRDVNRYRYYVGDYLGTSLGQIDYLDHNNLFNNVGEVDNVLNRLRRCEDFVRDSDVNTNRNQNWGTRGGYNDLNNNRNLYDVNRFDLNRDLDIDRDALGRGNFNRGGFNNNRYGGFGINNDNTGDYSNSDRNSRFPRNLDYDVNNNDAGILGWYRIIYSIFSDDDSNVRGDNDIYGRGKNFNRNTFGGRGFSNYNDRDIYGHNVGGNRDIYGRNVGGDRDVFGRNVGGNRDIYGRNVGGDRGIYGRNVGGDRDIYGRNVGGDRDIYGRNVGGDRDSFGHNVGGNRDIYGRNVGGDRDFYGRSVGGDRDFYGRNVGGDRDFYGRNVGGERDYYGNTLNKHNSVNDRDIYGRNNGLNNRYDYNDDTYNYRNVVGRDHRLGGFRENFSNVRGNDQYNNFNRRNNVGLDDNNRFNTYGDNSGRYLYFGLRHGYDRDSQDN